jgi:predicted outer membrane lipoprotein
MSRLSAEELADLAYAKTLLENPSLIARIAAVLGTPIERLLGRLPKGAGDIVNLATRTALETALSVAVYRMEDRARPSSNWTHKGAVIATGAVGGAFGLAALAVELPVSTTIILRSIADVARSEGEVITSAAGRLACLEVFALGGGKGSDDGADSSYFAVRATLAKALAEAAEYIAERGGAEGAPVLVRFIARIASRFSGPVSEKVAAQAAPVVGAAGGAIINALFMDHFQDMARGHFIVRRLERKYGQEVVKEEYTKLPSR